MANPGRTAVGIVGAVIGFVSGGPIGAAYGFQIGYNVGALIFPTKLDPVYGPKIADLKTTTAVLGDPIPVTWGTIAVPGTVIALGNIREVAKTEEVGGKGDDGGQKYTTYTYYQTIAIGLCECTNGPIGGIWRIWENGELKYDARPIQAGETEETYSARAKSADAYAATFTLYLGTDTQLPDTDLESIYGDGNVPGFRDLAYIVFPDRRLLETQALHHPVFKFEVWHGPSALAVDHPEYIAETALETVQTGQISPDWSSGYYVTYDGTGDIEARGWRVFRIADNVQLAEVTVEQMLASANLTEPGNYSSFGFCAVGGYLYINFDTDNYQRRIAAYDLATLSYQTCVRVSNGSRDNWQNVATFSASGRQYIISTSLLLRWFTVRGTLPGHLDEVLLQFQADRGGSLEQVVCGGSGVGYAIAAELAGSGTGAALAVHRITISSDGAQQELVCEVAASAVDPECTRFSGVGIAVADDSDATIILNMWVSPSSSGADPRNYFFKVDPNTGAVLWTNGDLPIETNSENAGQSRVEQGRYAVQLSAHIVAIIDTTDGTHTTVDLSEFIASTILGAALYDARRNMMLTYSSNGDSQAIWFDRPTPGPVSIATIIRDICERVGLDTVNQLDVSELEERYVDGYAMTRPGPARSSIEPLRQVGFFDQVEVDGKLTYPVRGREAVATLTDDEIGAHLASESRPPAVSTKKAHELELPRQVRVHYISPQHDYDTAVQLSPSRYETDAISEIDVHIPVVLSDTQAATVAGVLWADAWASRWTYETSADVSLIGLDPADVVHLPVDGRYYRARIVAIDDTLGAVRRVSLVRDDDGVTTSYAVPNPVVIVPGNVEIIADSVALLLDLPLLRDTDDDAGFYAVAYREDFAAQWAGAIIMRSASGGETYSAVAAVASEATVGTIVDALPAGDFYVIDDVHTLTVSLAPGQSLESRTLDAVLGGANAAAIGAHGRWEIIQFLNAAKISENSWALSGLLRGRRGTEHAMGSSESGDQFVLLSNGALVRVGLNLSERGAAYLYKAVSSGASTRSGDPQTFAGDAEALKPFSPAHIGAEWDGGDLVITWTRRGRIGQELRSGSDIPISEATERYEVDIYRGGVKYRTIAVADTQTATYTAAQQTADFGGPPAGVTLHIYQLSDRVGRGHAGIYSIGDET